MRITVEVGSCIARAEAKQEEFLGMSDADLATFIRQMIVQVYLKEFGLPEIEVEDLDAPEA